MKKILYSLFVIVTSFSSCVSYKPATGSENKKTITDIPLRPYTDKVDVYTNNDLPTVPFYKVQMVDVKSQISLSYDELLKKLTEHAKALGMDGIILVDKTNWTEQPGGYVYNRHYQNPTVSFQELSAVGLKYQSKMDYVDSIVKESSIDFVSKGEKHIYSFDFYGNLVNNADDAAIKVYEEDVLPFDITRHTHGGVANWEYDNSLGWVISFRLTQNDTTWVSAVMAPESIPTFYKIDYTIRDRKTLRKSKYTLNCLFDISGKIKEKKLWQKEKLIWREELLYNANKLIGFKRYKTNGNEEVLELQASNSFFSTADLPAAASSIAAVK